ncbi:MAG: hypothetical protein AAF184_17840 [Pseudomonadota bacterium]
MTHLSRRIVAAAMIAWLGTPALAQADSLEGADVLLCSSVKVTRCPASADCETSLPWELNIPQFLHIDLAKGEMSTTQASGEARATAVQSSIREEGMIVLQGVDNGRAFSFMIMEESGLMSVAVARDGVTVSVFGACTPVK